MKYEVKNEIDEELQDRFEVIGDPVTYKMESPIKNEIHQDVKPKIDPSNEIDEDMKKGLQVLQTLKGNEFADDIKLGQMDVKIKVEPKDESVDEEMQNGINLLQTLNNNIHFSTDRPTEISNPYFTTSPINQVKIVSQGRITCRRSEIFVCNDCKAVFISKFAIANHVNVVHLKLKSIKCKICDAFIWKSIRKDIGFGVISEGNKSIKCDICSATISQKMSFKKHFAFSKPFQCSICDDSFITKQGCDYHIESVHEGKKAFQWNLKRVIYKGGFTKKGIHLKKNITLYEEKKPF